MLLTQRDSELARFLAERSRYPDPEPSTLALVSQYVAAILGRAAYRYLRAVFDTDYPPTSLHRFIARLPALLRERDRPGSSH